MSAAMKFAWDDAPTVEPNRYSDPIAWLRWWAAAERWEPLGLEDDYRIFGHLLLSDIRRALAEYVRTDAALIDASAELAFYQELAAARGGTLALLRVENERLRSLVGEDGQ